jgi:hypothetical protein
MAIAFIDLTGHLKASVKANPQLTLRKLAESEGLFKEGRLVVAGQSGEEDVTNDQRPSTDFDGRKVTIRLEQTIAGRLGAR